MDFLKALMLGVILSATIGLVIGSQGVTAGPLAIHAVHLRNQRCESMGRILRGVHCATRPRRARDAVATDTPASRATSLNVAMTTAPPFAIGAGPRLRL